MHNNNCDRVFGRIYSEHQTEAECMGLQLTAVQPDGTGVSRIFGCMVFAVHTCRPLLQIYAQYTVCRILVVGKVLDDAVNRCLSQLFLVICVLQVFTFGKI